MNKSNSLEKAYDGIKDLKEKSLKQLKKNCLTYSELSKYSGVSRNNFSKEYIKKYPEWKKIRQEVDEFKKEFNQLLISTKIDPIITELQVKLDNSYKQNIELLAEINEIKTNDDFHLIKIYELQKEKELLNNKLKEYINKFGLL